MKGLIVHPLRLRALDRMTVLRVPFREQPSSVEYWLHGEPADPGVGNPIFRDSTGKGWSKGLGPFKPPYAPGEYFCKEAWAYGGNPYLYKIDDPTASKKWFPARSMKEIQSRYLLTLGPPVPLRLGEVRTRDIIKEGYPVPEMPELSDEEKAIIRNSGAPDLALAMHPAMNLNHKSPKEWHKETWNHMYPKHTDPDRWTWGYPMEVRRR